MWKANHRSAPAEGLNFGTKLLTDIATWPRGRDLPEAMNTAAAHIFAFDALIANDDRRYNNPNVLVRGDDIFVIDHEAAFAFLYLVSLGDAPWQLQRRASLRDHVFYHPLRRQTAIAPDVRAFIGRLAQLGDAELEDIIQQVPGEWAHNELGRISDHLQRVRNHAAEFHLEVLGALS